MGNRKWWLHNSIETDFGESCDENDRAYVCTVTGENVHDPQSEIYFLKNKKDAYQFVCEYLKNLFKTWGKDDIDNKQLKDWKNLFWRLNYGSGDGPTEYNLQIEPIVFEQL